MDLQARYGPPQSTTAANATLDTSTVINLAHAYLDYRSGRSDCFRTTVTATLGAYTVTLPFVLDAGGWKNFLEVRAQRTPGIRDSLTFDLVQQDRRIVVEFPPAFMTRLVDEFTHALNGDEVDPVTGSINLIYLDNNDCRDNGMNLGDPWWD